MIDSKQCRKLCYGTLVANYFYAIISFTKCQVLFYSTGYNFLFKKFLLLAGSDLILATGLWSINNDNSDI